MTVTSENMLRSLQELFISNTALSLEVHAGFMKEAVFTVEDDEAYFVIKHEGMFYAIIGEIRGESHAPDYKFVPKAFGVNQIHPYKFRDSAICCVLSIATTDSGGSDCIREIARERAPWFNH